MITAVAGIAGLIFLCWLVFTLAVNALPLFAALSAGMLAFDNGAGPIGTAFVAAGGAVLTVVAGRFLFVASRSSAARLLLTAVFAVPAAVAGYQVAYGLVGLSEATEVWREALGFGGSLVTGTTAWSRLSTLRNAA